MKKIIISLITALAFSFSAMAQHPDLGGGDGTSTDPYQISTPTHLKELTDYVSTIHGNYTAGIYYKLMNDIDLSAYSADEGWLPISGQYTGFQGNFDGNGKVVRNLTINRDEANLGLFGYTYYATIENLGIENCYVDNLGGGYIRVGGLVGYNYYSTITNCYAIGNVNGDWYVGGLVGYNQSSTITNCYTAGTVNGTGTAIGGLVGYQENSTITASFSRANVSGTEYVGGLLGRAANASSIITNCYATGNVSGAGYSVGGLAGISGTVSYCYATGNVKNTGSGYHDAGGLFGSIAGEAVLINCVAANDTVSSISNFSNRIYGWDGTGGTTVPANLYALEDMIVLRNGNPVSITDGSPEAGIGKDMATLQSLAFYTTADNWEDAAWDFGVWNICDGLTLPWLRWENIDCGDLFIPVTNITGVPTTAMAGVPLTLTATVLPYNATHTAIVWSVEDAGSTGATIVANVLNVPTQGTVVVKATIADGLAEGTPYTQNFTIEVGEGFVAVTDITNVPAEATAGAPLALTATILPANASFQNISWSVTYAGTTGATITGGNIFNAASEGMAMIKATIANGAAMGTPFTKEFSITVKPLSISEITAAAITVYPNPTNGQLRITSNELQVTSIAIFDMYGKQVQTSLVSQSASETAINISHLPNGIYSIRITTDKGLVNKKVIKH